MKNLHTPGSPLSMTKILSLFTLLWISGWVRADYVDIAAMHVNGTLVRKMTRNSTHPYLVNLSQFQVGDTLQIDIWTDHGAEQNCVVTITSLETGETETLNRWKTLLITSELLEREYLVSVTFTYSYPHEFQSTWDICRIVPDPHIEKVYASMNELRDFLLTKPGSQNAMFPQLLKDSVEVNYFVSKGRAGELKREMMYAEKYPAQTIPEWTVLNPKEMNFLQQFNAIDYTRIYGFSTNVHSNVKISDDLNSYSMSFGDFTYQLEFFAVWEREKFVLERITLREK